MITIDGKEYRNLEEQVRKNKEDIEYILEEEGALNQFGIKVVGQVDTAASLPDPTTYAGEYGDAYAVGTASPYVLYIWTRANGTHPNAYWFNIGTFPLAGPKGEKGDKGDTGSVGPKGDKGDPGPTGETGATGKQGPVGPAGSQGIQGLTGEKGEKGDPGEPFVFAGKLTSTALLPDPSTVGRNTAYLIPDAAEPSTYDMYVITGDTTLTWENAGHVQSVKGDKGDTGSQGPVGPQGPVGATGGQGSSTFIYDGVLSASVTTVPIAQITVPSGKILQVGDILISSYADSVGAFARVTSLNTTNAGVDFVGTFQTISHPLVESFYKTITGAVTLDNLVYPKAGFFDIIAYEIGVSDSPGIIKDKQGKAYDIAGYTEGIQIRCINSIEYYVTFYEIDSEQQTELGPKTILCAPDSTISFGEGVKWGIDGISIEYFGEF